MPPNDKTLLEEIAEADIPDEEGVATDVRGGGPLRFAPDVGAAALGTIGARVAGPPGAGVGGAVGDFAGHVIQDTAEGLPFPGTTALSMDRLADHLIDAAKTGVIQAGMEALVPYAGAAMEPVRRGLAKAGAKVFLPKKPGEMIEKTEAIVKKGGGPGLTAGQMVEDQAEKNGVKIMENISYNAFTSQVVNDTRMLNEQAVQTYGKLMVGQLEKLPPSEVGDLLTAIVRDRTDRFVTKPLNLVYEKLRAGIPGEVVMDAIPVVKLLRDKNSKVGNLVISGLQKIREGADGPQAVQAIDDLIGMMSTPIKGKEVVPLKSLTIDQAFRLKTELSRIGNKKITPNTSLDDQAMIANAGHMAQSIDRSIKSSLVNAPDMLALYEKANAFASKMYGVFRDDLLKATVHELEKRPGRIASTLLKPDNQDTILAVRAAVGPRWNAEIEPLLASSILRDGYDAVSGRFVGTKVASALNRLGAETVDAAIKPKTYNRLLDFAKALEHVAQKPSGVGGVYVQLATAGAIGGVAGAGYAIVSGDTQGGITKGLQAGTLVLLAPWVMGHLVANPKWLEAMKTGLVQTYQTGKPSSLLLQTLRQAGAASLSPETDRTLQNDEERAMMLGVSKQQLRSPIEKQPRPDLTKQP